MEYKTLKLKDILLLFRHDNHQQPHLGVSHGRQGVVDAGGGGGHGQQGRDGQHHPGRGRLVVQPEGHPGHGDRHGAGHVHRHYEERQLAGEQELDSQAGVSS